MGDKEEVKVYGMWASPFSLRVEWALKLKGVEYEYVNEDVPHNKSAELIKYNPVHKKIPVLVHRGRGVAESALIVEYIDEVWNEGPPIMPHDPYERALARFWAKFFEDKVLPAIHGVYSKVGEEQERAVEELRENLKIFGGRQLLLSQKKGGSGYNKFFGGEKIGFVDIVAGWIAHWIPMIEQVAGVKIVTADDDVDEQLSAITTWFSNLLRVDLVKNCLPPLDKLIDIVVQVREQELAA